MKDVLSEESRLYFRISCLSCSSCPINAIQMGQATQAPQASNKEIQPDTARVADVFEPCVHTYTQVLISHMRVYLIRLNVFYTYYALFIHDTVIFMYYWRWFVHLVHFQASRLYEVKTWKNRCTLCN